MQVLSHISSLYGLHNTKLSESCILEHGSSCGYTGQNVHFKDKGKGKEPLIAQDQLQSKPQLCPVDDFQHNFQQVLLSSLGYSGSSFHLLFL